MDSRLRGNDADGRVARLVCGAVGVWRGPRVARLVKNRRFVERVFSEREMAYCRDKKNAAQHFAVRFAAKEAISKAFGTGIGKQLGWQDMEIGRKESGEPFVILHDGGLRLLQERGGRIVHLSLSHTENYATAFAILES